MKNYFYFNGLTKRLSKLNFGIKLSHEMVVFLPIIKEDFKSEETWDYKEKGIWYYGPDELNKSKCLQLTMKGVKHVAQNWLKQPDNNFYYDEFSDFRMIPMSRFKIKNMNDFVFLIDDECLKADGIDIQLPIKAKYSDCPSLKHDDFSHDEYNFQEGVWLKDNIRPKYLIEMNKIFNKHNCELIKVNEDDDLYIVRR